MKIYVSVPVVCLSFAAFWAAPSYAKPGEGGSPTQAALEAQQAELDAQQAELEAQQAVIEAQQAQIDTLFEAFSPRRAFVTSGSYTGNLGGELSALSGGSINASGIAAGDAICQFLADDAQLNGTFLAWLGSPNQDLPATRFTHSPVAYINTRGETLAFDWADLTDGTIVAGLDVDEQGNTIIPAEDPGYGFVWTNVYWNGTRSDYQRGTSDCAGWTSSSRDDYGVFGISSEAGGNWSHAGQLPCQGTRRLGHHLYCFEQ